MEKYGYVPEENENLDAVLDLFDENEDLSEEDLRKKLREDSMYSDHFSTTKQQQLLHILFDRLEADLKSYLKRNYGFSSTKLLFKKEASSIIEEYNNRHNDI